MLDRTWMINSASSSAVEAGYSDDLEFFVKELGKTYIAIWQAWTVGRHVLRHYGDIFLNRCNCCRGAGIVTCKHCHGYKSKRLRSNTFSLALMGGAGAGSVGTQGPHGEKCECHHCGTYCKWDNQENWHLWTTIHEVESDVFDNLFTDAEVRHTYSDMDDEKAGDSRYVDPEDYVEGTGDTDFAGWYTGDENGEVHPHRLHMSEFVYNHPEYYDNPVSEAVAEAIDQNIAAGVSDRPKPYMFEPAAGTVPCPACNGRPWFCDLIPNLAKLGGYQFPFWFTTMQRMGAGIMTPTEGHNLSTRPRPYLEYPRAPQADDRPILPRDPFSYYSNVKDVGVNLGDSEELEERRGLIYLLQNWDDVLQSIPVEERDQFRADVYQRLHIPSTEAHEADPGNYLSDQQLLQSYYGGSQLDGRPKIKWNDESRKAVEAALASRSWENRMVKPLEFDIETEDMLDGALVPREKLGQHYTATLFAQMQPEDNFAFLRMVNASGSSS